MTYATVEDVAVRSGRQFGPAERERVQALLDDVSGQVRAYCTRGVPDPAPETFRGVVAAEVARLLNTTPGISSERTGDVEVAYSYPAASAALSGAAKSELNPYRHRSGSAKLVREFDC